MDSALAQIGVIVAPLSTPEPAAARPVLEALASVRQQGSISRSKRGWLTGGSCGKTTMWACSALRVAAQMGTPCWGTVVSVIKAPRVKSRDLTLGSQQHRECTSSIKLCHSNALQIKRKRPADRYPVTVTVNFGRTLSPESLLSSFEY